MWNLKYDTNEPVYETNIVIKNRWVVAKPEGVSGLIVIEWEVAVSGCKLIYIERIGKQQGSPYSTESYIQYPMINHNEKECF